MAVIEKNVSIPTPTRTAPSRKLGELAQEIYDTLGGCEIGDSFVVNADYKRAALIGGRMAARLGYGVRAAVGPDAGTARLWRVEPKVKKAKVAKAE